MSVLEFLDYQPEFRTPIWDYLAGLVDEERVADALAMREKWAGPLAKAAERYQVDADTVIAVWGVESNFGRNFGKRPLLTSLGTLACFGRRQAYFRGEFLSTLKILDTGDIAPGAARRFVGRRFRPYPVHAVDLPAPGGRWRRRRPRDLMDSVPDALASTANFLHKAAGAKGEPWGYEVVLPTGFDSSVAGRRNKRPLSYWTGAAFAAPMASRSPLRCRRRPAPARRSARPRLSWSFATST
jgi:membrane-bound lytic murein transglycosylase B